MLEKLKLEIARTGGKNSYSEENPLVSVRIPTKNRGKLLIKRAITSAINQTYKNIEIVVVGDYCTDNTGLLLKKVGDPRIRFHNLPQRPKKERDFLRDPEMLWFTGPVRPTNKASELVRGEWIAPLDDDDTWTDDHIEVLLKFAQEENLEFVSGDYIAERNGERRTMSGGIQTWLFRSYLKLFKCDQNCWKKSWNRVFDLDVYERMEKAGVKMGHLDKVVAYVVPRPGESEIGLKACKLNQRIVSTTIPTC